MRNPDTEARKEPKVIVNFKPVIYLNNGEEREGKKGEAWKLVNQGKYLIWGEPASWFIIDHIPIRLFAWWILRHWFWELRGEVTYQFRRVFSVEAGRWVEECMPGATHMLPRKVEELEARARVWRSLTCIALVVGISIGVYLAR